MNDIKAIFWDFAGVILYTIKGTFNSLLAERLGVPESAIEKLINSPTNDLWDIDEIDDLAFYTFLLNELGLPLEKMAIIERFVVKDFYIDQAMIAYIKEKRKRFTSVLLTNFPAHIHKFMKTDWNVDGAFDQIIASCDVKLIKPDPAIYGLALERAGCKAHQVVFIDDRQVNITAAQDLGMQVVLCESVQQTISDLDALLAL